MAKKKTNKLREYNVWQSRYNEKYKYVKKYGEEHGLSGMPDRVNDPTYEDIKALNAFQKEQVAKAKEIREAEKAKKEDTRDYYAEAANALLAVKDEMTAAADNSNHAWKAWEQAKAEKLSNIIDDALRGFNNRTGQEWGKFVLKKLRDFKKYARDFVFDSMATYDNNHGSETTTSYDYLMAILHPVEGTNGELKLNPAFVDEE